jgi:hypothetical protein
MGIKLAVQEYLRGGKTVEDLNTEFAIKANYSEDGSVVLLGYDQLDSPKTERIVRECRSIILEVGTWDVVSFAFYRFFNYGENEEEKIFNWNDFSCAEKVDGSFMTAYHYNGEWKVHTRGMVEANGQMGVFPLSFKDQFFKLLGDRIEKLNTECCYTFEICSLYNKVVREYKVPQLFLLSAFNKATMEEIAHKDMNSVSLDIDVQLPIVYEFSSYDEIEKFLLDKASTDPTYEGVVVRDSENRRLKIKSVSYLKLHHLADNEALFALKNLVPLVMVGEIDEIVAYMKEAEYYATKIAQQIDAYKIELQEKWDSIKHINDRKSFAMEAKEHKFAGMLFSLYLGKADSVESCFLPTDSKERERIFRTVIEHLKKDGIEKYAEESMKLAVAESEKTLT